MRRDIYGSTLDVPLSQLMKQKKKKRSNQDSRGCPRPKLQCPWKQQACVDELPVKSIDQAIHRLDERLRSCGLVTHDMPRDGSCYFHAVVHVWWLVATLSRSGARQLLVRHVVSQKTVRNFFCSQPENCSQLVIDDESEETVRTLAIHSALHDW